jgi:hypothetical protein
MQVWIVLQEKEIIEDVELYASELNEGSEYKIKKENDEITPKDKGSVTVKRQKTERSRATP